ncbi:MAG: hypothetical protein ACTSQJ_11745 [Promethearchaeota archaeon]
MKFKFHNQLKFSSSRKKIFPLFLVFTLIICDSHIFFSILDKEFNYLKNKNDYAHRKLKIPNLNDPIKSGLKKNFYFTNISLNDSISFQLDEETYTNEIYLNFTNINETRDFIKNGDFNSNALNWNAKNESDIIFEWKNNSVAGVKCISINLTGRNSKNFFEPMKNGSGIEDFSNLNGWTLHNNDPSNFITHGLSPPLSGYPPTDGTYALKHKYNGTSGSTGMANSTYQFYYNSSFEIFNANLSFWYKPIFQTPGINFNTIEIGVLLTTPSKQLYLINNWKDYIHDGEPENYNNKVYSGISKYFNETGKYNLTFYSKHYHNGSSASTTCLFDYIKLTIVRSYKELNQSNQIFWNQTINFNRGLFSNGIFNFSYYITDKFNHINDSNIYLCIWINSFQYSIKSLKSTNPKLWIKDYIIINKSIINSSKISVKIGLYCNKTTYIFPNESFSIFFDNISFILGAIPKPSQIDLKVYSLQLDHYFSVRRDLYNNDFAKVSNKTFTWLSNQLYVFDLICNTSNVIVNFILSYFIFTEDSNNENDTDNGNKKDSEIINVSILILSLILIITFSSTFFIIRFQKRLFLNPNYDYIKKLKLKRKISLKKESTVAHIKKIRCSSCGKLINATAKFCEHCGKTQ